MTKKTNWLALSLTTFTIFSVFSCDQLTQINSKTTKPVPSIEVSVQPSTIPSVSVVIESTAKPSPSIAPTSIPAVSATPTPVYSPTIVVTPRPTPTPTAIPFIVPTPTPTPYYQNDFTPPSGKADKPWPGDYGPWNTRLMMATSVDGLTWTRTNKVIADQADVPDIIMKDGKLMVYFVTYAKEVRNKIAVAISQDYGATWLFKKTTIPIPATWASAVDPKVVILDDGSLRLYFTSDPNDGGKQRTYSATSVDGINFKFDTGTRLLVEKQSVLDPTVLKIGDKWHLFAGGAGNNANYHAVSSDGIDFTREADLKLTENLMMSNGVALKSGYRFYVFENNPVTDTFSPSIKSIFSSDGKEWTTEAGQRLKLDTTGGFESAFVKDCGILQLPDKSYLMVYVTVIK